MNERVAVLINLKWHIMSVEKPREYRIGDISEYMADSKLISFQCGDLIRTLNRSQDKSKKIPDIIDLECLDRQMSQEKKKHMINLGWNILKALREHGMIDSEFVINDRNISIFLDKICDLYLHLNGKSTDESKRFQNIEQKINSVIYERQALGITIDSNLAKKKCAELEREIYRIKNELQIDYEIFDPDNEVQQKEYLKLKEFSIVQSLLYSFKVRRKDNHGCQLFYDLLRNSQDLDSLVYILSHWGKYKKSYPSYFGFGTITSRITLRQPSLQNLRKENRSVIIPDEGYKFLYIDYSQFEAGILACLSDDDVLINQYNIDIYSHLAAKVLGDLHRRDEAKIIFYRYIYGDETLELKAVEYFNQFNKLKEYQRRIEEQAKKKGKLGTIEGNYRICSEDNSTWALSHIVQATASLIYKRAVIRTKAEVNSAEFLIPMHDGTLYQLNALKYEENKKVITEIYIAEFKAMFPKIEPKVNCSDFFG